MDKKNNNFDVIKMVNDHSKEMRREPGKIINLTNYTNSTESPRQMINSIKEDEKQRNTKKRNIKNKPSNRKWLGKLAVVAASVALFGAFVEAARNNENKPEQEVPTTEYVETYKTTEPDVIDTITEVEEDFVKDYLEAYNEKYGTEYKTGEMIITALRDGAIYELSDGRKVTRGSKPYETEKVLNNIGKFDIVNINSEVVQIMANGRVLGTYNMSNGEFIYSGNQLSDVTNGDFEEPTLESLGIAHNKLNAAARVKLAKGVEDKQSIDTRIDYYNDIDEEER